MKKSIIALLLLTLPLLKVQAQTDAPANRHTLGIDIRPFFDGGRGVNLQYTNTASPLHYRLAVGLNGSVSDQGALGPVTYSYFLRSGLGTEKIWAEKFRFAYGADLLYGQSGEKTAISEQYIRTFAFLPYLGVSYQITPQLSVATEVYSSAAHVVTFDITEDSAFVYQLAEGLRLYARFHF